MTNVYLFANIPNYCHFGAHLYFFLSLVVLRCSRSIFVAACNRAVWILLHLILSNNMMDWMSFIWFFQFKQFDYNEEQAINYFSKAHELCLKFINFVKKKHINSQRRSLIESISGCYGSNIYHKFLTNVLFDSVFLLPFWYKSE